MFLIRSILCTYVNSGVAKVGHMPHQLSVVPHQKIFLVKFEKATMTLFKQIVTIFLVLTYPNHP